jgi:glycosyltransferase involved in cell wall biosynthesis
VATAVGGTPDLLGKDERGLLVPPGEPEAMAAAVVAVLEGSEASRRRAQAGREHVLTQHSSERLFQDMDALYRELRVPRAA